MIALLLLLAGPLRAEAPTAPSPAEAGSTAQAHEQVTASLVVEVSDEDAASKALVAEAKKLHGWFSALTNDSVTLRVPVSLARELVDYAQGLGTVMERSWQSVDLSDRFAQLDAKLASRQQVLQRYMAVLKGANAKAIVSVEREITRLIGEIEQIKGELQVLENQAAYATATVSFKFRDRTAPASDGRSSFAWINAIDVRNVLRDFANGDQVGGPAPHVSVQPPDGFAPYPHKRYPRALSPDDVVFRVRAFRNKPQADLAFWREALRTRMVEAGYRLVSDEDVQAGGRPGAILDLAAPIGQSDVRYLVALFVRGHRIIVVEAAGLANRLAARRAAIVAAIRSMKP